jgi:hypothetical protein
MLNCVSSTAAETFFLTTVRMILYLLLITQPALRASENASWADKSTEAGTKDAVTFVNGDCLSGRLLAATKDQVIFNSEVMGQVTLQWKQIRQITVIGKVSSLPSKTMITRPSAGPAPQTPDNQFIDKDISVVQQTDGMLALRFSPPAPVQYSGPDALLHNWAGFLRSDTNLLRATQKKSDLGADLHASRLSQSKRQVTLFDLQANYSDSKKPGGSPVITDLYKGDIEHDIDITNGGTYLYLLAGAYHNSSLGLQVVQGYGGGIGWQGKFGRRGQHKLTFSGDSRYWKEDVYSPGVSFESAAFGLTEGYEYHFPWPKVGQAIVFTEKILFLPICNHSNAFQSRAFAQLNVPFSSRFSIDFIEEDDYARNAPHNTKQNYSSMQIGLKYSFGQTSH